MPKIPQGNFDAAPSTNVQMARVEPIKAVNSKELRAMGQRGIQLANTWDNITAKANALEGVSKAEEEVEAVSSELDTFVSQAQAGKFQDKPIAEYAKEKLESIRTKHLSSMSGNSTQIELYDQLVAPKMQNIMNKVQTAQTKQIVDYTETQVNDRANLLFQKMENGTFDPVADMQDFDVFLNTADGILPRDQIAKIASSTRKTLAINASRMIANEGWSPEVEQKVKNIQAQLGKGFTEAERLAAENNLQKNVKQGMIVAKSKAEAGFKDTLKSTERVDTYVANKGRLEQTLNTLMSVPPLPYENPEERTKNINTLAGKMIAAEVAQINGNVLRGRNDEEEIALNDKLNTQITAIKARLFGDRAPANAELDNIIRREIAAKRNALDNKGTALSSFMEVTPEYLTDLSSHNPDRVKAAVTKLNEFYSSNGVAAQNRTIVPTEMATAIGKSMTKLAKGSADPTGEMSLQLLKDVQSQYGEFAGQAIADIISMGGGSKSGETAVPATWTIADQVSDDGFAATILGAKNRLDDNKKAIDPDEYKKIKSKINSSQVLTGVRNGLVSDNLNFSTGYAEAVESLAASYMVGGEKSASNAADAVKRAEQEMQKFLSFSRHKDSSVVIPSLALKANQMTQDELDDTLESMTDFRTLMQMDDRIDWASIAPDRPNSDLGKALSAIASQKTPEAQATMAKRLIGDNLVVVNNGDVGTNASLYIRTPTAMVPLVMKVKSPDGQGHRLRKYDVDMLDMIKRHRASFTKRTAYGAQEGM